MLIHIITYFQRRFKILSFHCNIPSDTGQFINILFYFCFNLCLYLHVTVDIFEMSLNKYDCHITNISHIPIVLNGHIDPTFLHIAAKIQPTAKASHINAKYMPQKIYPSNALYMPYIPISSYADMRQLCQYVCLI